jgi:hypothetical protein
MDPAPLRARPAERLDKGRQHLDGLLGWMQAAAGIAPLQHVRDGQGRALHLALGEKVGGLVLGSEEPGFRSVALAKDDMCAGRILQGDCTQHMRAMSGRSVDFILTDPPHVTRYRDRSGRSVANDDMSTHRPVDESAGKEGADERARSQKRSTSRRSTAWRSRPSASGPGRSRPAGSRGRADRGDRRDRASRSSPSGPHARGAEPKEVARRPVLRTPARVSSIPLRIVSGTPTRNLTNPAPMSADRFS